MHFQSMLETKIKMVQMLQTLCERQGPVFIRDLVFKIYIYIYMYIFIYFSANTLLCAGTHGSLKMFL